MTRSFLPVCFALVTTWACAPTGPHLRFVGRPAKATTAPESLEDFGGSKPPEGFRILGVLTARCQTYDGTAGLASGPCSHATLSDAVRRGAAKLGGQALLGQQCERRPLRKEFERKTEGGAAIHTVMDHSCQATVLRRAER